MNKTNELIKQLQSQPALNKKLLLALLTLVFIPHWISAYHVIHNSIAPDLLLRTIGSRLQQAGKPIYQYQWKLGDPVSWLNPYPDTRVGLNGVISTPFLLSLLQPFARLDYCKIKFIWGCTQEFFLFATMCFCCISFKQRLPQLCFIVISVLFFVYDRNWLLNLYNGQMYIVYAFIFALTGYLLMRGTTDKIVVALFPFISLIRPFFITALIPFFKITKQYSLYFAVSVILTVFISITTTSLSAWKQYNQAMKLYAKEQTGELALDTVSPRFTLQYADVCTKMADEKFIVFGAGCLYSLQHYLYLTRISVSNSLIFEGILALLFVLILFIAYKKDWLKDLPKQLLLSFLFYQLCELITPASRNPYNMIQWLPPVAWLIAYGNKWLTALIVAGLCLNHDIPFWFKYEREIGEIFLFVAIILFLCKKNLRVSQP